MRRVSHGPGQVHGHGQGRWYQERNQHRNSNNSDTNMQPQRGGYIPTSVHNPAPLIRPPMPWPTGPLPLPLPFGNTVLYRDGTSGIIYFLCPPHPPLFPSPFYIPVPYHLLDEIKRQIDFYFSVDNLVKDTYLRLHMDEQGWVHASVNSHLYTSTTRHVELRLDFDSPSVKLNLHNSEGDKMRRRDDWMRWLMPPGVQRQLGSQPQSTGLDEGHQLQPGGGDRIPLS
ncbi:hypothetical protein M8C21_024048 [Ambrosia artemisiifolia]|uniref:HTH La-type RNA-binding domain-containing protein n=1 Tax=Ambrosia artemisiifolia TaxID=4212 RepID=A0AAD5C2H2_AMBAR|nr:hypothetical protein M8C21_024048 [Ambrosia artemisiifolia]